MQVVLAVLALVAAAVCSVDVEDGVYVGTDANFQGILESTEFVLAEFYAPWCGHCKSLAPEYAKAAQALADLPNVKLVKADATIHTELSDQFSVSGYPTLKWIKNGKPTDYSGGRTASEIISWVRRRSGPASAAVDSVEAAQALFKVNDAVVFGAFADDSGSEYKAFLEAASRGELIFAHTFSASVAAGLGLTVPSATSFKHFDEKQVAFTEDFSADAIAAFGETHSLPILNEFSDKTASKIFGGSIKQHLLLFAGKSASHFADAQAAVVAAAGQFRGKMLFVLVDTDVDENERVLEFFNLKTSDTPAVRIINLAAEMTKFTFTLTLNAENLSGWIADYLAGKVQRHLNSQPLPEDWDAQAVKVLVNSNFAAVALNEQQHALVEFYAPWCGHCKELAPTWDALAEKFAARKDVVVAKIDMTANELANVEVQSFPTIKFFKIGSKESPVDYDGARDLAALTSWLEAQLGGSTHDHDEF